MYGIKLFAKKEKEPATLIQTIRICNPDIGMEFGIEKCDMLMMKSGKRQITKGIELPTQERIRTIGRKENYMYLGILKADTIKKAEMKEKKNKRLPQKFLDTKLCNRNLIKGISTWTVSFVRYSGTFLK